MLKVLNCLKKVNYINRNISMCRLLQYEDEDSTSQKTDTQKTAKRKIIGTVELITLVDQNGKILGLKPKPEAEKLANKLNLSLERVTDTKYGKAYPAYKMFSVTDLLKVEKKSTAAKVLKKLPLNSRITDHDLSLKLNTVRKWLSKNCEVHIAIARNNEAQMKMKNVLDKIKEQMKDESRMVNIREAEESIKLILLPPKEISNKSTSESKDSSKDNRSEDS